MHPCTPHPHGMLDAIYTISETLKKDFGSRVQRIEGSFPNYKIKKRNALP